LFSICGKRGEALASQLVFSNFVTGVSNVRPAFALVILAALFEPGPRKAKARFQYGRAVA
jgi:hypothetical protein